MRGTAPFPERRWRLCRTYRRSASPSPSGGIRIPEPKQRQEYANDCEHHGRHGPTEYERDDKGDEVQAAPVSRSPAGRSMTCRSRLVGCDDRVVITTRRADAA